MFLLFRPRRAIVTSHVRNIQMTTEFYKIEVLVQLSKRLSCPCAQRIKHYAMVYRGVDVLVYIHMFLTSALAGGEWSASRPGRFTPWERDLVPFG
jgi:hypothetical protein